jgi:hypothetical protein
LPPVVPGWGMMGAVATVVDRIEQVEAALWEAMGSRDAVAHARALEEVIALAASDPAAGRRFVLAELYDDLAEQYERLGRVDDALAAMRRAIAAGWAGSPDGRSRLAEIMLRAGRVEQARPVGGSRLVRWLVGLVAVAVLVAAGYWAGRVTVASPV